MEPGASVDPRTLRPKRQHDKRKEVLKKTEEDKQLKEKTEDLALVYSEEGERFKGLISGRMEKRIEELIKEDLEMQGYLGLLNDMGHRFNAAKRAVEKLFERVNKG